MNQIKLTNGIILIIILQRILSSSIMDSKIHSTNQQAETTTTKISQAR